MVASQVYPGTVGGQEVRTEFTWWIYFSTHSMDYDDPILRDIMPEQQLTAFICAFAAWARNDGRWSGDDAVIQQEGMSAVRHTFKCNFRPYTAFRSDVVSSVRTALRLTDMIDEARQNKEGRLPYTVGIIMMQGSRDKAADSDDALGTHHDDGHHGVGDVTDVDIFVKGKATPSSTDTRRRREEEQRARPYALRCRARSKTDIQEARGSDLRVRGC